MVVDHSLFENIGEQPRDGGVLSGGLATHPLSEVFSQGDRNFAHVILHNTNIVLHEVSVEAQNFFPQPFGGANERPTRLYLVSRRGEETGQRGHPVRDEASKKDPDLIPTTVGPQPTLSYRHLADSAQAQDCRSTQLQIYRFSLFLFFRPTTNVDMSWVDFSVGFYGKFRFEYGNG